MGIDHQEPVEEVLSDVVINWGLNSAIVLVTMITGWFLNACVLTQLQFDPKDAGLKVALSIFVASFWLVLLLLSINPAEVNKLKKTSAGYNCLGAIAIMAAIGLLGSVMCVCGVAAIVGS